MASSEGAIDVKRYDRQIRLWGLDTQRGLLGTRVLLLRASGLCDEAAKNLVLAGVGHVSIQDPDTVTADDLAIGGAFSLRSTDIGRNKAEAMVEHLQPMNPSVEMDALTQPLASLPDEKLRQFHFIIGTHGIDAVHELIECEKRLSTGVVANGGSRKRPREVEKVAKTNGTHVLLPMRAAEQLPKMIACGTLGMFGFCALDLLHNVHTLVTKNAGSADANATTAQYQIAYPTIADAFSVDWASLEPRAQRLYCAIQLLMASKDPEEAEKLRETWLAEAGLTETFLTQRLSADFVEQVAKGVGVELSPICAIMGGMVAAEVIKIISGRDAPINNLLLLDAATPSDAAGVTVRYGPAFQSDNGINNGLPKLVAEAGEQE